MSEQPTTEAYQVPDDAFTQPELRVIYRTGNPVTVVATQGAFNRWDLTRASEGWPDAKDAPSLWLSFIAWAELRFKGMCDFNFEEFMRQVVAVVKTGDVNVDPTPRAATPASSSNSPSPLAPPPEIGGTNPPQ